jgi:hypothetical protein
LDAHVTLDVEGIDRLDLNAYQPRLQTGSGVAYFFRMHRGAAVASTLLMAPMSHAFVTAIEAFAKREQIDVVHFHAHQNKDEETQRRLALAPPTEGVLYIGVAQEKFSTFRVSKRCNPLTGDRFPWLSRSEVMCNQDYFYLVDEDFGPVHQILVLLSLHSADLPERPRVRQAATGEGRHGLRAARQWDPAVCRGAGPTRDPRRDERRAH